MTKQLLQSPTNIVLATCRTPSKADALQALAASSGGRLHVLRLDVNDIQSIKDAARDVIPPILKFSTSTAEDLKALLVNDNFLFPRLANGVRISSPCPQVTSHATDELLNLEG